MCELRLADSQVQTEAEIANLNKKEKHLILPRVQVNCMIIFSCHRSSIQVDTFVHFKLTLYIHHLTFSLSTQLHIALVPDGEKTWQMPAR